MNEQAAVEKRYKVILQVLVNVQLSEPIEADSEAEAIEQAQSEFRDLVLRGLLERRDNPMDGVDYIEASEDVIPYALVDTFAPGQDIKDEPEPERSAWYESKPNGTWSLLDLTL